MYKTLKAEMVLQDVTIRQIAEALGLGMDTVRLKINGKIPFRISECQKVATLFKENNDIGFLFKETK